MRKGFFIIAILAFTLAGASSAEAQNVLADSLRLRGGPCTARAGAGTPEGVVSGVTCDTFEDRTTGQIFKKIGTGTTGWYPVLGPSAATCTTFAGCVAAQLTIDTTLFQQVLRTDPSVALRTFVTETGARVESFDGSGWRPLFLSGGPTRIIGGGLAVGTPGVIDPGFGNMQIDGFVGQPGYVSQTTGWRIDGLGAADFRYLFTDELHARKFIADLEQALAGLQIIAKSVGMTGAPFTVPAAGVAETLVMKDLPSASDMAIFESGDYVWIRTFSRAGGSLSIGNAYGIVTAYTDLPDDLQSWTFTRLATNGGAMVGGTVVEEDSIVLDVGVPGNGWVETNAIDGLYGINSPYTQVVTWSGNSPISGNQILRTRLGNLRGITGVTGEYGIIAGTYAATSGKYFRGSNTAFELHGANFSLWDGATKTIELNRTAPSFALGSTLPSSYGSGTGVWMGRDAGVYKFRVGAPGGAGVFWDGTTLNVSGTITVTAGNAAKIDFTNVTANYAGSTSVAGSANDTAAVNGTAAATVSQGAIRANTALNSSGTLVTKVIPASAVAPSGAGLYLGSDYLGYYNGSAWRTYMDNSGNFYLGGAAGPLQWNAGTNVLSVTGAITVTGGNAATTTYADAAESDAIAAAASDATTKANNAQAIAEAASLSKLIYLDTTTIKGGMITTGSILAAQLAADSVTSAKILAGTIVASDIAAGSITADRLSVSTLSAITADLGTVTAGNISGTTIVSGSGSTEIRLDSDGLTFRDGTSARNAIKWDGNSRIYANGGDLALIGDSSFALSAADGWISANLLLLAAGQIGMNNIATTTDADYPLVAQASGNYLVRRKTDGLNGTTTCAGAQRISSITVERGIVTAVVCS